jgi:hypothetical protein
VRLLGGDVLSVCAHAAAADHVSMSSTAHGCVQRAAAELVVVSALASAASSANQLYLRYTLKALAINTMH